MSAVRNAHVQGLAPDVSEAEGSFDRRSRGSRGAMRGTVRNGHVPGLAPGMAKKDGR